MLRKSLALIPILLGASIASADTYTFSTPQLVLLPYPHSLHAQCHQTDWYTHSECSAIRQSEYNSGKSYAATSPVDFLDATGQHKTGRRDVYDQTKVKGTTSETSF